MLPNGLGNFGYYRCHVFISYIPIVIGFSVSQEINPVPSVNIATLISGSKGLSSWTKFRNNATVTLHGVLFPLLNHIMQFQDVLAQICFYWFLQAVMYPRCDCSKLENN